MSAAPIPGRAGAAISPVQVPGTSTPTSPARNAAKAAAVSPASPTSSSPTRPLATSTTPGIPLERGPPPATGSESTRSSAKARSSAPRVSRCCSPTPCRSGPRPPTLPFTSARSGAPRQLLISDAARPPEILRERRPRGRDGVRPGLDALRRPALHPLQPRLEAGAGDRGRRMQSSQDCRHAEVRGTDASVS